MKKNIFFSILVLALSGLWLAAQQKPAATRNAPAAPAVPSAAETAATPAAPAAPPAGDLNYKYEIKGRRDPFRALDVSSNFQSTQAPIVRPPGLKGNLISEINLVGIVRSGTGLVAMAQGYRNRALLLHSKDSLYDGTVVEVRSDAVIFSQTLKDDEGKTMTQQIIKKLQPTRGEGK
jgi:hypothetical protein